LRADRVFLVFRKDLAEIMRNPSILVPVVLVPILFSIGLPAVASMIPSSAATQTGTLKFIEEIAMGLPPGFRAEVVGMNAVQFVTYILYTVLFAPFFLVIPTMISSVLASDSFAGEKERRTIEPLLATPLSDYEIFVGKVLVSFIPAMLITFLSFLVYTVLVDLICSNIFGGVPILPSMTWLVLVFFVSPSFSLGTIGLTVAISARVKGFREAQYASTLVIIPIVLLIIAQSSGMLFLGPAMLMLLGSGALIVDLFIFVAGVDAFNREEILARLV
jgi:ABC-2 type transport system permease protein